MHSSHSGLELLLLLFVQQAVRHDGDLPSGQRIFVGDDDLAVDAERGRHAGDRCRSEASKSLAAASSRSRLSLLMNEKWFATNPRSRAPQSDLGKLSLTPGWTSWHCADSVGRACVKEFSRRPDQAERLLAAAQFQPEQKMAGVQFHCLLDEFQRQRELFVVKADARRQPRHEPVLRRQQQRLFETVIRPVSRARASNTSPRASQM